MYLKEIEIQGFKSFADKTKVVLDPMDLASPILQKVCVGPWGSQVLRVFVAVRCQMSSLLELKVANRSIMLL